MILYFTFSYFKQVNIALTESEPHCSNHEPKYCKNTLGVYLLVNVVANNILVYSLNLFPHLPHMNYIPLRKKLYWNHTSAWVFSCKFAAYFQNTFFWEHLWVATSEFRIWKKKSWYCRTLTYWNNQGYGMNAKKYTHY